MINEISVSLQKKKCPIKLNEFFLLKIAQNAYHPEEFVLVMDHFLRLGTTGLIDPSPGVFFVSFNAQPDEEGQATSSLESLFYSSNRSHSKIRLQAILIPSFKTFSKIT